MDLATRRDAEALLGNVATAPGGGGDTVPAPAGTPHAVDAGVFVPPAAGADSTALLELERKPAWTASVTAILVPASDRGRRAATRSSCR